MARIVSYKEALDLPEGKWTVSDVLEGLGLLWSDAGVGKTFIGCSLAVAVASDRHWLGHRVNGGPVVYVAGEGGAGGVARRLDAAATAIRCDPDEEIPLWIVTPGVDLVAGPNELLGLIGQIGPRLVVIDTLNRCFIGNENDTEDMTRFINSLDKIRDETKTSTLVVHHASKDSNKVGSSRIRGNGALYGGVDVCIELRPQSDGTAVLIPNKLRDRDATEPIANVRFEVVPVYGESDTMGDERTTKIVRATEDFESAIIDVGIGMMRSRARTYDSWRAACPLYPKRMFDRLAVSVLGDPGTWGVVESSPGRYCSAN